MERAQHKAYARDPGNSLGTFTPKFTIDSLPNDVVVARASKLGVSLGKSSLQVSESVDLLKQIDYNRSLTILNRDHKIGLSQVDDDLGSLVLQEAMDLSTDLQLDEPKNIDDHKDLSIRPPRTTRVSKKSVKDKSVARRSDRLRKK